MLFVALSGQFVALGGQLDKVVMEYRSYIRVWTDYDSLPFMLPGWSAERSLVVMR